MKIFILRHGMTPGNKLGRYIGSTDETLSEEGKMLLLEKQKEISEIGKPDVLFVSPMKRCKETAELFYPGMEQHIVEDLREFNFGIFENLNYKELSGSAEYQAWVDSMCEAQVPGGESMTVFQKRSCRGFLEALRQCQEQTKLSMLAFVVHGGTIMSLMERYADLKKGYYEWSVKNGEGYLTELDLTEALKGQICFTNIKKVGTLCRQ